MNLDALERLKAAISERYRIDGELGAGGMATVYRAVDLKHDRPVAIKVLRPELAASLGSERFLREIRITAGLSHPHILPLIDSGDANGSLYYVMPLVDGESLRARLDREKQLPIPDALAIARAVGDAVAFAHRQNLIHRDIKPENILLGSSGPMVADFGIARATEPTAGKLTETGLALGTPGYMSPEQALGDETLTTRSDVYSLGCLLYEMVVGEPPFTGPTPQAILARAMTGAAPRASITRDTVSDAIDDVIATALAKAPADRYPNAGAFVEALAKAESTPGRRGRRTLIAWRRILVPAVVAAAAAVVAVLLISRSRSTPRHDVPTLVVLPFENLGTADDAGFADGVSDEITAKLADVKGIAVKSRQSALAYRGTQKTPQEIGRELDADYLVQATVSWETRADGKRRVRVRPRLVKAADGTNVWTNSLDEDVTEVFVVQANIAQQVVTALAPTLAIQQTGDTPRGVSEAQAFFSSALSRAIPHDPDVREGTLDNGLHYYVRANGQPAGRAQFQLIVNAGSVVEGADEHGVAHLVEHMAFAGASKVEGQLQRYAQSIGVARGDLNAATDYSSSMFWITVPTQRAIVVDSALLILRAMAGEARVDSAGLGRLRRVVMQEWREQFGSSAWAFTQQINEVFRDVPAIAHPPLGDTSVILRAPRATIEHFYEQWYRPEHMAVIAVGDFSADSVEQLLRRRFAELRRPGRAPARPSQQLPDRKDTRFAAVSAERASPSTCLCYLRPMDTLRTIGAYREFVVRSLLTSMLDARLAERAADADAPFLAAQAGDAAVTGGLRLVALQASTTDSGYARGFEALFTEAERAVRHGFTERELTRAKARIMRTTQQRYDERGKRLTAAYMRDYTENFRTGSPVAGIAFEFGLFKRFLPTIGTKEVDALAKTWLSERNRSAVAMVRASPGARSTVASDLHAVLETTRVADIAPYQDRKDVALPTVAASAGAITKTEELAPIGVTIWTLANGARVVLKPTDFRADDIQFAATRAGGTSLASDADLLAASMAPAIATRGGFGTVSGVDLRRSMSDKVAVLTPSVRETAEYLSGRTSPKDLEAFLQLLALHFTPPRPDSAAFQSLIGQVRASIATRGGTPVNILQDSVAAALANGTRRREPLPPDAYAAVDLGKALAFYGSRFGDVTGFTFVFAGSFDLKTMRPLVEKYIGSLPASKRPARFRDIGWRPPAGLIRKTVHGATAGQSVSQLVFTGPFDYADTSRQHVRTVTDLLSARLNEKLREQLAGSYRAGASMSTEATPRPTYRIDVSFEAAADRTAEMTTAALQLIEDLATRGPTEEELARVREVQRRTRETSLRENAYWATQLAGSLFAGLDPRRLASSEQIDRQTPSMIRDAAKRFLTLDRYVLVQVVP